MTPATEQDLAEAVKSAAAQKQRLRIQGGGTRQDLGKPVADATPLRTSGLSGVSLYEPGALTIVAAAGTSLAEVEATLASEGQRLPFEPMDHQGLLGSNGKPTIGSVVVGNISGPRRIQAGACRDSLIGIRMVDGRGNLIKNGGRVMKNVTGYDLVKLMCGSFGTLGVLTEVSFKVLPKPEARAVVLIDGLNDDDAIAALSTALGAPYDVTGAAHVPVGMDGEPVTMIRIEGFEKSVAYRAGKLKELLDSYGDIQIETDMENTRAGWAWVRDVAPFQSAEGDVWRVSVKPSDGPKIVSAARAVSIDAQALYDWGGGLVWLMVPQGTDLRSAISGFSGHANLVRASAKTRTDIPVNQPEAAPLVRIAEGLRAKFDPDAILNPGLMG